NRCDQVQAMFAADAVVPMQDRILSGPKIPVCGVARTTTISHVRPSNRVLMSEYSIKLLYRRSNHLLSRVFGVALSSGPPRSNSLVSHAMGSPRFASVLSALAKVLSPRRIASRGGARSGWGGEAPRLGALEDTMTTEQKIIRAKIGLLELAKQLGNVSQACKMMGHTPHTLYPFHNPHTQTTHPALH